MADVVGTAVTKIYENTNLTVKARIDTGDVGSIEEVTFKFLKDGKQFEEKTVPVADGESSGGQTVVSHVVKAPAVPDDKDSYFLDYHYFYKIKNPDASSESLQNFPASRIQVFPRTAQLKVTDKDGKAFHGFEFRVEQDGVSSEVCKTVAADTPNAKGETIPAGSCEFNLGLSAGFRIVPSPPYQILEEVKGGGRKREIKGSVGFRAMFVAPAAGSVKQYVNFESASAGQTGIGNTVMVEVGAHPDDGVYLAGMENPTIYFRAAFGPGDKGAVLKSERNDDKHPTKILKPAESDKSATIEEKEAKKKYQGKVVLSGGYGKFIVSLGLAGGDSCSIEISGSEKFLADASVPPDATLQFENWRRVHYELMVPNLLRGQLDSAASDFGADARRRLDELGRSLFIEFVHDKTHLFNAVALADYGTLVPKQFLGNAELPDDVAYVLGGRNWREPPQQQAWSALHPGKTLYIAWCDKLLKWRTDTADAKAGTKDFSGTLKDAVGSINVEEKFEGLFMPFSGFDASEGVKDIHWTADISKGDAVCKYKPALTLKDERYDATIGTGLAVTLELGEGLPARAGQVVFRRLPYPELEVQDKTEAAEKDDGKLKLKESALGKELSLDFEIPAAKEAKKGETGGGEADADASDGAPLIYVPFDASQEGDADGAEADLSEEEASFSDFGPIPRVEEEDAETSAHVAAPVITADHAKKIDDFFKGLFKDGKSKLAASEAANRFVVEIQGGKGADYRTRRIAELARAVAESHFRTHGHDQHDFKKDLSAEQTAGIQAFVDGLLQDKAALGAVKGQATATISCAKDAKHGVDDCFNAVKNKLKELFDAGAKEFASHPGLDPEKDFAPREGDLALAEITDVKKSSLKAWHFVLPAVAADGTPAPGAFIGPEKTADRCPVKFEISFQPHETSPGEADGKLIAWAVSEPGAPKQLISLILRGFAGTEDKAALAHGHGDNGKPGDCLLDADELCEKCIAHGRSRNLTQI